MKAFSRAMLRQHVAAGLATLLLACGGFWLFVVDRRPPLEVSGGQIIPPRIAADGAIVTVWTVRVLRVCPDGTGYRRIVDARKVVHYLESGPSLIVRMTRPTDGFEPVAGNYREIPLGAAPGPAKLLVDIYARCRWWHQWWPIVVELPELQFEILEKGQSG